MLVISMADSAVNITRAWCYSIRLEINLAKATMIELSQTSCYDRSYVFPLGVAVSIVSLSEVLMSLVFGITTSPSSNHR